MTSHTCVGAALLLAAVTFLLPAVASAEEADWPQWRRNEYKAGASATGIETARKFPAGGPQKLWEGDVEVGAMSDRWPGPGTSSLVAAGGRVIGTFYRLASRPTPERYMSWELHPDGTVPFNSDKQHQTYWMRTEKKRYAKWPVWRALFGKRGGSLGAKVAPAVERVFPNQQALDKWFDEHGIEGAERVTAQKGFRTETVWRQGVAICVDAANGRTLWEYTVDDPEGPDMWQMGTGAIADGRFFAQIRDRLVCLDARTGKLIWEVDVVNPGVRSLLVADGVVVLPYPKVTAYDAKTGKKLWQAGRGSRSPGLVRRDGKAVVTSNAGAFELQTGKAVSLRCLPKGFKGMLASEGDLIVDSGGTAQASLYGGLLYRPRRANVICSEPGSKKREWTGRVSDAKKRASIYCASAVYADGLVISEQSVFDAADGTELTVVPRNKSRFSTPVYAWGKVFYRGDRLACFDLRASSYRDGAFTAKDQIAPKADLAAEGAGPLEKLKSKHLFVRRGGMEQLRKAGAEELSKLAPQIVKLAIEGEWPTRKAAGKAIEQFGPEAGLSEELLSQLAAGAGKAITAKDTPAATLLCAALSACDPKGEAPGIRKIVELADHEDDELRWEAIHALGVLGPAGVAGAQHAVDELTSEAHPTGRALSSAANAAWALGRMRNVEKSAALALANALTPQEETASASGVTVEHARFVKHASKALGRIGIADEKIVNALVKALGIDPYYPAMALSRLTVRTGKLPESLLPALTAEATHAGAVRAFMFADPDLSVPMLIEALKSEKPAIRWGAANALGRLGVKAKCRGAEKALEAAPKDSDPDVAREAADALKYLMKPGGTSSATWKGRRVLRPSKGTRYRLYGQEPAEKKGKG
jgi:hypothetical protein